MSSLGLRVTSLGVLPRLRFEQGDGDGAENGWGGACPELCEPCVQRSSQHVPSQISFLILFPCWRGYLGADLTAKTMVEFLSMSSW